MAAGTYNLNKNLAGRLTYHIEAAHVPIEGHVLSADLDVVARVDTVRSHEEAEDAGLGVHFLDHVEDAHDHVVATCCLTSAEHQPNLLREMMTMLVH
jgi:hypothetical protein